MAMAAACIGKRKTVPALARTMIMRRWETTRSVVVSTQQRFVNHCINGQHLRLWAAAEKSKCSIHHRRRYCTSPSSSAGDLTKLGRSTGNYNYDLAVRKTIQHYHKHIKVGEEDGQNAKMYPVRGAKTYDSGVEMYHILLNTIGGEKYISIYLSPQINHLTKLDDEALKLVFFRKLDTNVSLPFHKVVGEIRWPVAPRNNPLIMAAARFALAQRNVEEKLERLTRASSQMVWEHEIFRMNFKGEFSGESNMYDAIVVPRETPEKMELVMIKISDGSKFFDPHFNGVDRYKYEDEDEYAEGNGGAYEYEHGNDERVIDDPRVSAAARFALALHHKKDQVRRVVEATRRTYSGDEILSMRFDGELDSSRYYRAIVLVPVNDPENMRLAYFKLNFDESKRDNPDLEDYLCKDKYGFRECSADDPQVIEVARFALVACYKKNRHKDKRVRVVKATRKSRSRKVTYRVRFVGGDHPSKTYVATVSVGPHGMNVEHVCPEVYGRQKRPDLKSSVATHLDD